MAKDPIPDSVEELLSRGTTATVPGGQAGKRRPTMDDIDPCLNMISEDGKSLRQACRALGIHHGHMHDFLKANGNGANPPGADDLWDRYLQARARRGEVMSDEMRAVIGGVIGKTVKPDAGRVALGGLQWLAERMDPDQFGQRSKHELTGKGGGPIQFANAADLEKLSIEELEWLQRIMLKLTGGDLTKPDGEGAAPAE